MVENAEGAVEPVQKEAKQGGVAKVDPVDPMRMVVCIVGIVPVDQQTTPDHGEEDGKLDPVHPANYERVLALQTDGGCRRGMGLSRGREGLCRWRVGRADERRCGGVGAQVVSFWAVRFNFRDRISLSSNRTLVTAIPSVTEEKLGRSVLGRMRKENASDRFGRKSGKRGPV